MCKTRLPLPFGGIAAELDPKEKEDISKRVVFAVL